MAVLDERVGRAILTILLVAAFLGFVWAAWRVLATFLFAVFFAYLVDPLVQLVSHRLHFSRGRAIFTVYVLIVAAFTILFLFIGPNVVQEAQKLARTVPDIYQRIASGQIAWQLGAERGWSNETRLRIQQFLAAHNSDINRIATDFAGRLALVGKNAWWLVLIPILAAFFLKDGAEIQEAAVQFLERRRQREFVRSVAGDVHQMLAQYIRAQLLLSGIAMTAYILGLLVLRVPYASILGVIGGFLEFIPIVGPLITALLMIGVALGAGYRHLGFLILYLAAWRVVQDYLNAPHLMGSKVRLHPLVTLFGVLAGAEIGGIIGVYLSVPTMATLRILWLRWQAYTAPTDTPASDLSASERESERDLPRGA